MCNIFVECHVIYTLNTFDRFQKRVGTRKAVSFPSTLHSCHWHSKSFSQSNPPLNPILRNFFSINCGTCSRPEYSWYIYFNVVCKQIISIILYGLIVNNTFRCIGKNSGNGNNDVNLTLFQFEILEFFILILSQAKLCK